MAKRIAAIRADASDNVSETPAAEASSIDSAERLVVHGKSYRVVEHIEAEGADIARASFPVVVDEGGSRRIVVSAEDWRAITATGRIRAKRASTVSAADQDDPRTLRLSDRSFAILSAIASITGDDISVVIENSLSEIAGTNDIGEQLLNRILQRVESR